MSFWTWSPPLALLGAALVSGLELPWLSGALLVLGCLWAPGVGWARALGERSALQLHLDAAWISIAAAVVQAGLLKLTGGGIWTFLLMSSVVCLLGLRRAWRCPEPLPAAPGAKLGGAGVLAAVLGTAILGSAELQRPLEDYWYHEAVDQLGEATPWTAGSGWEEQQPLGWEEAGAARLWDEDGEGGTLRWEGSGRVLLAIQGPVGARLSCQGEQAEIESDPVELSEEGAVPRYLERGVAGLLLEVEPGEVSVDIESEGPARVYVLPGTDAAWALHELGELRLFHYYQILNMVENLRWAEELWESRWLTINQPPLWSPVLSLPVHALGNSMASAGLLFLGVLVLLGLSGVRVILLAAPRAPSPALLLPGVYVALHAKLMIEPASFTFPDSLYAAAFTSALAALWSRDERGARRFGLLSLAAGLLRYPGTIALSLIALIASWWLRRSPRSLLGWTWAPVAGVALILAAAAGARGELGDWLFILWFETLPEHYHGDYDPQRLLGRVPEFYGLWLRYSGGGLALALLGCLAGGRASRALVTGMLSYSLMLCTIDHFPTHYFLPLLAMTGLSLALIAAELKERWQRQLWLACALLGPLLFLLLGRT